jgi:hypothetical protein
MSLVPFWFVPKISHIVMCQSHSLIGSSDPLFYLRACSFSFSVPPAQLLLKLLVCHPFHDIISCSNVLCLGHHHVQTFYSICDQSPILMSYIYNLLLVDMS